MLTLDRAGGRERPAGAALACVSVQNVSEVRCDATSSENVCGAWMDEWRLLDCVRGLGLLQKRAHGTLVLDGRDPALGAPVDGGGVSVGCHGRIDVALVRLLSRRLVAIEARDELSVAQVRELVQADLEVAIERVDKVEVVAEDLEAKVELLGVVRLVMLVHPVGEGLAVLARGSCRRGEHGTHSHEGEEDQGRATGHWSEGGASRQQQAIKHAQARSLTRAVRRS